mmetsp:Transcript_22209/g.69549  ORF Transcript_22209/g.69549 Transcript_22209/m.69549 type:complete len:120 (+) Transcript_22209:187-546(+)
MVATFSRELLSAHSTTATFEGFVEGKESMLKVLPPRPNKQWATFKIVEYLSYEKPGSYGDEQKADAQFTEFDEATAATIAALEKGQRVRLDWAHNYVTRVEGEGTSKYPERVITKLEAL